MSIRDDRFPAVEVGEPSRESPAVQVRNLYVTLGKRRHRREAVHDLSLDVINGVHGLLGPNGAGKTTLIRALATAVPATSGTTALFGLNTQDKQNHRSIRSQLGYLPQSFGFYPRFTVREFVSYFAWLKEYSHPDFGAKVEEAIARVGLTGSADQRLKDLSGGTLRRAGIAQAIVNAPRLLLLDEPTAGLDPEQRVTFRALLRELSADTTIAVSTHLVEDVMRSCDRVSIMTSGRIIWTGTPGELAATGVEAPGASSKVAVNLADPVSAGEAGYARILESHRKSGAS